MEFSAIPHTLVLPMVSAGKIQELWQGLQKNNGMGIKAAKGE
jgi:hypothetical protein